ncbi:MAG: hypothetical protein EB015_17705 [Methylocystaceae bacterium]|nr:hypothetical protein [Methylocystaceae bacterium]
MDNELISQHKRLAMGLPVNNEPAGASKNMVNDMVTKHASYGIIKNLKGKDDAPAKSGLKTFEGRK